MTDKHILATSTAYKLKNGIVTLSPVIKYGLGLTNKESPKICYLGTADGDDSRWINIFYNACQNTPETNVKPSHVQLFTMPNVIDVKKFLLSQDMIWVGGGSVANLLAVWRVHGLDRIMHEAWEKGIILSGVSAGSICWHTGGTTDSFGVDLQPVTNGLGFLSYSNGVHYDSEERRRPLFHQLINDSVLSEGYATDDGVGIHYLNDKVHKVVADKPNKFAYHVVKTAAGVVETMLEAELLS